MARNWNKVFCIGFSKTGTSSLHTAFRRLGFKSRHNGPYDPKIDCFTDWFFWRDFKKYDQIAPNSKFILNVREPKSWLMSIIKHSQKTNRAMSVHILEDWIFRMKYNHKEIQEYFKDRKGDLLIFDVCKGDGYKKLCDFLEIPVIKEPFPKKNVSRNKPRMTPQITRYINSV